MFKFNNNKPIDLSKNEKIKGCLSDVKLMMDNHHQSSRSKHEN